MRVSSLTLEEKVGQLLMVHFRGEEVNADAKALVQDLHVGGICYYAWANGLHSPDQVRHLSQKLQELSPHPLLIAVDQEGGAVSRLREGGFTLFPGNCALGTIGDPQLAQRSAQAIGEELRSVGINCNLAPVLDVHRNPCNPVMGSRSFGSDPQKVARLAEAAIRGYHEAHIATAAKHWPGHGNTRVDSHYDLPLVEDSREVLDGTDLFPFQQVATQTDAIMTAHLLVAALDPHTCITLSQRAIHLLRDTFAGVILTDSLVMQGLLRCCPSVEEAAVRALAAGHDMLCLGGSRLDEDGGTFELRISDVRRIHARIVAAVRGGELSIEKIDDSVQRIAALKERLLLTELPPPVDFGQHKVLSAQISKLSEM